MNKVPHCQYIFTMLEELPLQLRKLQKCQNPHSQEATKSFVQDEPQKSLKF